MRGSPAPSPTEPYLANLLTETQALALALTGQQLPLTAVDLPAAVRELNELGWDSQKLAQVRKQQQHEQLPWPFKVPLEVRKEIGFARFAAQLAALRELLGITGLEAKVRSDRAWSEQEKQLASERPPHW